MQEKTGLAQPVGLSWPLQYPLVSQQPPGSQWCCYHVAMRVGISMATSGLEGLRCWVFGAFASVPGGVPGLLGTLACNGTHSHGHDTVITSRNQAPSSHWPPLPNLRPLHFWWSPLNLPDLYQGTWEYKNTASC